MKPSKRGRSKKVQDDGLVTKALTTNEEAKAIVDYLKQKIAEANPEFVITVTIEQNSYVGKGVTALDALRAIPMPELISTGNLVITHGDKRKEMLYPTRQLRRLFNIYHQDVLINDILFGL